MYISICREAGLAVENLEEEVASLQDEKAQCEGQLIQVCKRGACGFVGKKWRKNNVLWLLYPTESIGAESCHCFTSRTQNSIGDGTKSGQSVEQHSFMFVLMVSLPSRYL